MAGKVISAEKLQPEVRGRLVPYLEAMLELHADNLVSIIVYGSAASGAYVKGVSDINSVFVFKELGFQVLKKSLKKISRGISGSIAAPLFLTEEYIFSSLDVFPVEFMDMKENHVLVYGADIFSTLDIKGEHARLFCEQQIKGKLIRIRQAYLEVGLSKKGMLSLMKDSLNSLVPVFRNLIRIKGERPPCDKEGIIEHFSKAFGLTAGVFMEVYRVSTKKEKICPSEAEKLIEEFLIEIDKAAAISDKL
jgi:predicted nucleotidyltransferase